MQSLRQIEKTLYQTFYKGPPFEFWWINGVKNVKGGPYKISIKFVQPGSNSA